MRSALDTIALEPPTKRRTARRRSRDRFSFSVFPRRTPTSSGRSRGQHVRRVAPMRAAPSQQTRSLGRARCSGRVPLRSGRRCARWASHADGHRLAVLAARADAFIEPQIVPTTLTRVSASGPLPMKVAPLTGRRSLPASMRYASLAEKTNLPLVMSTCPPPKTPRRFLVRPSE